jgi:hypothetical protein
MLASTAIAASGCLVTEGPKFDPPSTIAPKIVPVTPPTEIIRVDAKSKPIVLDAFAFRVVSEEQNQPVLSLMIIDYGLAGPSGAPWKEASLGPSIPAGKLSDGPRPKPPEAPATVTWFNPDTIDDKVLGKRNCRTVTVMATHAVQLTGPRQLCPVDPTDVDAVTWTVILCEKGLLACDADVTGCPFKDKVPSFVYCDTPTSP